MDNRGNIVIYQTKDGAKQWNKGCKQGGNPYATDRGTAMAVCLEKRSGKSDLTAVSSEE